MKRVLCFLTVLWACAYLLPAKAQTSPCKADFEYHLNGNTVNFYSYNSTNHPQVHYWNFGDGLSSDGANPSHTYAAPGQYRVLHYVKDTLENCFDSVSKLITIAGTCNINPSFTFKRDSQDCRKIYFTNTSSVNVPNAHFIWKFGDGTSSTEMNPTHAFVNDGTYQVCLVIEAGDLCRKEICLLVEIRCSAPPPCNLEVRFNWVRGQLNPLTVWFTSKSIVPETGAKYKWSFGDGTYSEEKDPVHTYAKSGTYNVCLKIYASNTCVKELCKVVVLQVCDLKADFTWKKDSASPAKIYFKSIASGSVLHYQWHFGDGGGSQEPNPTHVYSNPGVYKVCLVISADTCKVEVCKEIEVRFGQCNIESKFTWKSSVEQPKKIQFYNYTIVSSSTVKYEWKFGDGTYSHEKDPVHLYEHAGEYEVCLLVWAGESCKKSICQKLVINECDLRVGFEWKKDPSQWNKIWFANVSQPVSNIWRTWWSYGDGTSSQDFNSFHVYQQPGKYYICLKVQSLHGCIESRCDSVIVRKPDSCENHSDFHFEASLNNSLELRFKPVNINLNWKYYWSFGDGSSSVAVTPVHKFNKAGVYKVCLTVVANNECKTTTCKEIHVNSTVVNCDTVKLKYEYKRNAQKPNELSFYAVSNLPVLKQKWTILRISSSQVPLPVVLEENNPTYTFRDTGLYMVCLYGTIKDCGKVYCERIRIEQVVNGGTITGGAVVYPNPVISVARVEFYAEVSAKAVIRVLDATGSIKIELVTLTRAGNNYVNIPVDKLSSGFYLVEIRYADKLKLAKFQKG